MAVEDPASRVERIMAQQEPQIEVAFLSMVELVRSELDLGRLADLVESGDFTGAFDLVRRGLGRMNLAWSDTFVVAGRQTGEFLTRRVDEVIIDFDQANLRAVEAMRNNQLRLVREFEEQQRRATQQALLEGIRRGANPREQARAFRDSIGLTEQQQRFVDNYRRALENLDRNALRRELRDRRFDPTVERAIREGTPLSQERIDRMVERYRQRMIKHRAEVIARTEALRAVHEGVDEMYIQAIEDGQLQPDQLVRIWNTAKDERVRGSHRSMHLQERQIGERFTSGAGNTTTRPGGFGIASEDILCRCAVGTRILSVDELPGVVGVTVIEEVV